MPDSVRGHGRPLYPNGEQTPDRRMVCVHDPLGKPVVPEVYMMYGIS